MMPEFISPTVLERPWAVASGVTSMLPMVTIMLKVLTTLLTTTPEPPSRPSLAACQEPSNVHPGLRDLFH